MADDRPRCTFIVDWYGKQFWPCGKLAAVLNPRDENLCWEHWFEKHKVRSKEEEKHGG